MISLLRQSRALLGPRLTGSAEHLGGALRTLTFQSDHPLFHLLDTHAATPSPLDQSPSLPRLAVAGFSAVMLGHHALLPQTALALAELQVGTPQPTSLPAFSPGAEVIDPPAGGADEGMLCHTKRTFQPSLIIRKRRHGFLSRIATRGGRRVIARRKARGRYKITA